ncbi:MAG: toll/interleukin-1 receptor domain-containing protein, partial [Candidatus Anammoximicrobium sp.]|nr:toll/interleukin-1 receptor domain-containing protein [Candidatus Anammoximicrobium sp.]
MSKHLFICYSTEDDAFARKVCLHMEGRGISCWFAPKDVAPGREFELAILDAIDGSGAMLLILTQASNASRFVQSEVNRAFSTGKTWGGPNSWRLNCRWGLRFAEPLPGRQGSPALPRQNGAVERLGFVIPFLFLQEPRQRPVGAETGRTVQEGRV